MESDNIIAPVILLYIQENIFTNLRKSYYNYLVI